MNNLHLIQTDIPSRIHLAYDKHFYLSIDNFIQLDKKFYKSFHIYITCNEEIKEGDWFYADEYAEPEKAKQFEKNLVNGFIKSACKKVILTTNPDLISDGVQSVDEKFLDWFIENTDVKNVEVIEDTFTVSEMSKLPIGTRNLKYKVVLPILNEEILYNESEVLYILKHFEKFINPHGYPSTETELKQFLVKRK